jgi:hypothetical protein
MNHLDDTIVFVETPEGKQEAICLIDLAHEAKVSTDDARKIMRYLSGKVKFTFPNN